MGLWVKPDKLYGAFFFFDDQLFETLILVEAVLESCKFPNCQERNQLIHDKDFGLLRPYGQGSKYKYRQISCG